MIARDDIIDSNQHFHEMLHIILSQTLKVFRFELGDKFRVGLIIGNLKGYL